MKIRFSFLLSGFGLIAFIAIFFPVIAQTRQSVKHAKWVLPKISSEPEWFDTTLLVKPKTDTMIKGRDTIIRGYRNDGFYDRQADKRKGGYGWLLRGYSNAAGTNDFAGLDYLADSSLTFGIYKQFYSNGKLEMKGGQSRFGFAYGTWYYYNEDGSLRKTLDCDKDFKFTTLDVMNYCEKNNISLAKNYDSYPTHIFKYRTNSGRYDWIIKYLDTGKQLVVTTELSADNGSLVKTTQLPYVRHTGY